MNKAFLTLTRFPKEKLHTLDSVQDGLLVLRMISTHKTGQLTIQQNRSHVLAESITYELTSPEVRWPTMSVRTAVNSRVFILLALHEFDTNRVATNLENRERSGENIFDKKSGKIHRKMNLFQKMLTSCILCPYFVKG